MNATGDVVVTGYDEKGFEHFVFSIKAENNNNDSLGSDSDPDS